MAPRIRKAVGWHQPSTSLKATACCMLDPRTKSEDDTGSAARLSAQQVRAPSLPNTEPPENLVEHVLDVHTARDAAQ
jgi:hypothetical protein